MHRDKQGTGTMTRMPRHLSRCLLAVTLGPNGSAQSAAMSGKLKLHNVFRMTSVVFFAVTKKEGTQSDQHLKQCNTHCCLNGTTSAMLQMAFIPTTPLLAATRLFIGIARSVHRDKCTSIKCALQTGQESRLLGVHITQASKCANATPWKPITPLFHLSGTLPKNDLTPAQVTSWSNQLVWWKTLCETAGLKKFMTAQPSVSTPTDGEASFWLCLHWLRRRHTGSCCCFLCQERGCHFSSRCFVLCVQSLSALCETHVLSVQVYIINSAPRLQDGKQRAWTISQMH